MVVALAVRLNVAGRRAAALGLLRRLRLLLLRGRQLRSWRRLRRRLLRLLRRAHVQNKHNLSPGVTKFQQSNDEKSELIFPSRSNESMIGVACVVWGVRIALKDGGNVGERGPVFRKVDDLATRDGES